MTETLAAFGGGMAALFAAWRMVAHYESRMLDRFAAFDKTNRAEHAALMDAIRALGERIAAVEGKLDVLISDRRGG